jgi:hypothetical protein
MRDQGRDANRSGRRVLIRQSLRCSVDQRRRNDHPAAPSSDLVMRVRFSGRPRSRNITALRPAAGPYPRRSRGSRWWSGNKRTRRPDRPRAALDCGTPGRARPADQQIDVYRIEAAADYLGVFLRWRDVLKARSIGADHHGTFLLDQPPGGLDPDARRIVLADLLVITATRASAAPARPPARHQSSS